METPLRDLRDLRDLLDLLDLLPDTRTTSGLTPGAESSSQVWLGRGHVGQAQGSFIEVLVGEQVSQTHAGGSVRHVGAELLLDTFTGQVRDVQLLRPMDIRTFQVC